LYFPHSMKKRVILEQGSLITALGNGDRTADALMAGRSAIVEGPCFTVPVAYAPFDDPDLRDPEAAFSLLREELSLEDAASGRTLFVYAAAKGDARGLEPFASRDDHDSLSSLLSVQARRIRALLGLDAASCMTVSNACASGMVACSVAKFLLEQGICDNAVVAGFDVLSHFVVSGFHSLGALSAHGARPFDAQRDGLSLGDGAALVHLSLREPVRGDIILAGAAQSNDANHRTGPSRSGDGLLRAALDALFDADTPPDKIGAVKCHGTATVYNDAMEAKAINNLFGAGASHPSVLPPCFSVKGATGHTSGAGSLIETILAAKFLRQRRVPPTAGLETPDPEAFLPVSSSVQPIIHPSMLCLSAGFGGLNAALLLLEHDS